MRTKLVLGLAALAASALTTMAQSNVYSLNVVGYYNLTIPAGRYAMIGNQLVQTNQSVGSLLASIPGGSAVLTWSGTGFAANNNDPDFGWDDPSATLPNGAGFMLKNNGTSPFTVTFVGEVNQNTNAIAFTAGVYKLCSLFTPQAGDLEVDFGYPPTGGDQLLFWSGTGYAADNYDPDFGWDAPATVSVGDGFFVKTAVNKTWTRSFKVQ